MHGRRCRPTAPGAGVAQQAAGLAALCSASLYLDQRAHGAAVPYHVRKSDTSGLTEGLLAMPSVLAALAIAAPQGEAPCVGAATLPWRDNRRHSRTQNPGLHPGHATYACFVPCRPLAVLAAGHHGRRLCPAGFPAAHRPPLPPGSRRSERLAVHRQTAHHSGPAQSHGREHQGASCGRQSRLERRMSASSGQRRVSTGSCPHAAASPRAAPTPALAPAPGSRLHYHVSPGAAAASGASAAGMAGVEAAGAAAHQQQPAAAAGLQQRGGRRHGHACRWGSAAAARGREGGRAGRGDGRNCLGSSRQPAHVHRTKGPCSQQLCACPALQYSTGACDTCQAASAWGRAPCCPRAWR
jgi:hypothetical protein